MESALEGLRCRLYASEAQQNVFAVDAAVLLVPTVDHAYLIRPPLLLDSGLSALFLPFPLYPVLFLEPFWRNQAVQEFLISFLRGVVPYLVSRVSEKGYSVRVDHGSVWCGDKAIIFHAVQCNAM